MMPNDDIMTARAMQQMRDTVASSAMPAAVPNRLQANAQPNTAAQVKPTEPAPQEREETGETTPEDTPQAPAGETDAEKKQPAPVGTPPFAPTAQKTRQAWLPPGARANAPAQTDSATPPEKPDTTRREAQRQRRQNRRERRNNPAEAEPATTTEAEESSLPETSAKGEDTESDPDPRRGAEAPAEPSTWADNPWVEAAINRQAARQIYRLFGRKNEQPAAPVQTPAAHEQVPAKETAPSPETSAGTHNPWVEAALRRSIPQTGDTGTAGQPAGEDQPPVQPDHGTTPAASRPTERGENVPATPAPPQTDGPSAPIPTENGASTAAQPAGNTPPAPTAGNGEAAPQTGTAQTVRQGESVRQSVSGYGNVQPYLDRLEEEKQDPDTLLEKAEQTDEEIARANEEYLKSGRNPLSDIVLEKQKPEPDEKKKKQLKMAEKLIALSNLFAAIGQGVGGFSVSPVDNRSLDYIRGQVRQLDNLYRNDKNRYDQNELLSAIRKDQITQAAAKAQIDAATGKRKQYMDQYGDAVEGNRDLAKKQAELGVKASEFAQEQAYKHEDLKEKKRSNRAREALQSRRIEKEYPSTLIREGAHYIELTPKHAADIAGLLGDVLKDRQSAKKGPDGEWISGKYPNLLNKEITDEELADLQGALKGGKLTATQQSIIARLWNRMQSGGYYDPEAEHPLGVAPKPTSGYAEANHQQYVDYVKTKHDWMLRTEQSADNSITIQEARDIFDMQEPTPEASVRKVMKEAGLTVEE